MGKSAPAGCAAAPSTCAPGGHAEFVFDHRNLDDAPPPEAYKAMEGEMRFEGRIVRAEAPRLLVFTWPEMSGEETEVTFELSAEGAKTRLVLTHRRLFVESDRLGTAAGWHLHLHMLAAALAGAPRPPFWALHAKLEAEYRNRFG